MMVDHGEYVRLLRKSKLNLAERMSLLFVLIRVELIFFAHAWNVGVEVGPHRAESVRQFLDADRILPVARERRA
jgi:hypothetical protein